jgi:DNA repair exonuclease SbcCD ATPase subunit
MKPTTVPSISIFIPRVSPNITGDYIAAIFEKLKIGSVDLINFESKVDRNGRQYKAVCIHFDHWFQGTIAANFQERVLNPKKEARIVYDDPKYWVVLPNTGLKEYKNVWVPTKMPVKKPTEEPTKKPTEEPKWVLLSLEQEKELQEDIEATWNENYVLKAELKKIREGDDAKINDLRLAVRRLESQAKKDADEIYNLQIELSENMMKVKELEDQLALVTEQNVMLSEKVVDLSSLSEKQRSYLSDKRSALIDKQQELIDETRKAVELEEKLNKSNDSVEYLSNAKRALGQLCRSILSPQTVDLTDAKDKICQQLYWGLTYAELMAKPEEERDEYWAV